MWVWELGHKERRGTDAFSQSLGKSVLNVHRKDWCWGWNSNTLATWYEELTHWKRPWCWERLKAGGEGDDRAWDGWMASLTWWTWVWGNSGCWWRTGGPGVLQSMGLQRVGHGWATEQQQSSSSGSPAWSVISVITCVSPQRKALGYRSHSHTTFFFWKLPFLNSFWRHESHIWELYNNYYFNICNSWNLLWNKNNNWLRDKA